MTNWRRGRRREETTVAPGCGQNVTGVGRDTSLVPSGRYQSAACVDYLVVTK